MSFSCQNVKTIRKGLPCSVNVGNGSGHDVLTTWDNGDVATVEAANLDVEKFFNQCVDEFALRSGSRTPCRPNIFGRPVGGARDGMDLMPVNEHGHLRDLDLSRFEEVLIQPVGLSGG